MRHQFRAYASTTRIGITAATALVTGGAVPALAGAAEFSQSSICEKLAARSAHLPAIAFRYENVLGTSFDMIARGGTAVDAHAAITAVLGEIDRLTAILSMRDPRSEISRLISTGQAKNSSSEIVSILEQYQFWSTHTGGAVSCQMQQLVQLWRRAEIEQREPKDKIIASALAAASNEFSWSAMADGTLRLSSGIHLNIDALGKAFIIDRALAAAGLAVPGLEGIFLNIGGDIAVIGGPWIVGIASPFAPAVNDPPLKYVALTNQAIATSAGYERAFVIGGRRYPHILDPRTGRPATAAASSSVIAPNAVAANALALALSVLGGKDGAPLLVEQDAAAIVVDEDRSICDIGSVPIVEMPVQSRSGCANNAAAWPADFQVSIALELKPHVGKRSHRPYLAVWVEDAGGKVVRTISVWGNDPKYKRDLSAWTKVAPKNQNFDAVTRATRQPGKYTITWDGLNDAGKASPAGKYTLHVEINREHGTHANGSVAIDCGGATAASAKIAATEEAEEITVGYARKDGK